MKKAFFLLVLAVSAISFSATAQKSLTPELYSLSTHDTLKQTGASVSESHSTLSQGDVTIDFQFTRHATDSVTGSARLMISMDNSHWDNYPGYENDTVIISNLSINKAWIVRKVSGKYIKVFFKTWVPNAFWTQTGYGTINCNMYAFTYPY